MDDEVVADLRLVYCKVRNVRLVVQYLVVVHFLDGSDVVELSWA